MPTRYARLLPGPPQELNAKGSHLLYRDKQHRLSLVDLATQVRTTLLPYVQYCQWVPGSDVVVAQNRGALCVWYTVKAPDK
jgi:intraflagellar transport protein 172